MRTLTLPLFLVCLLALATGCQKNSVSLDELQSELDEMKAEATQAKRLALGLKQQLEALSESAEKADAALSAWRLTIRESAAKAAAVEAEFAAYRKLYRDAIQKRAPGMSLADFKTATGSYASVRISQLDSWQIAFHHKDGFTKLDLASLPENLKAQLGYDPSVGAKPVDLATSTAAVNVYVPTAPPSTSLPATAPASPRSIMAAAPMPAPFCPIEQKEKSRAERAQEKYGDSSIITVWGSGGAGGGGTKIKSTPQPLPQGYKPIGSSFSGSAMDQQYKEKKKAR